MNNKITIPITRLVPGLIIGPASWLGPYIVMNSLFLPAMLQVLDPENKIQLVALFASMGMIVAAISNMVAGALSDRTHSRFGSRTPWIMVGALCFMGSMVGALFLSQFRLGFIIFGVVAFIGTLIAVLIVREPSNKGEVAEAAAAPKEKVSLSALRHVFPGWSVGRDYYLAFIGKMFQGIGNFAIMGYLLYIMTDFLKLGDATASSIQLINTIMLVFGILMGFFAGPFCDKFKVLKYPVAFFLGVYNLGNTLTQAIAPVIAAAVISLFGFSSIFLVSFAFAVIGGCCMFAIRKVQR